MPDCSLSDTSTATPAWQASLHLGFTRTGDATRLVRREHRGPLRVQKALYPEGPDACHVIVVHPPGGVVGGDRLDVGIDADVACHVLATSPGAAKWYRANGRISRQTVRLRAGEGAAIEWLPQETIFYDDAHVDLDHEVELAPGARYLGSEVLVFGRRASGERFASGRVRQRTRIRENGRLLWCEQGILAPAGIASPFGLGGHAVCATFLAVGAPVPAAVQAGLRAADPLLALSQVKSVFVARHLGDDGEAARAAMLRVWQALRPHYLGRPACMPRIWNT
ncbi:urease accessory protein UreD [Massilia sp. YIM B02763]|uniref:urease accessory protein UreD n=1 Tax=Massilia sp. YIM B02763 TaxID=3050130 RepID=UPI0025B6EBC5|nr:urease accessory protein UreD [Massilia sp. YIM B02763]MDN4056506.1 urease accessory protein UreD [Massilia sp. YIM B02763]